MPYTEKQLIEDSVCDAVEALVLSDEFTVEEKLLALALQRKLVGLDPDRPVSDQCLRRHIDLIRD